MEIKLGVYFVNFLVELILLFLFLYKYYGLLVLMEMFI